MKNSIVIFTLYKRLGKIQPIIDSLQQSFQSVYSPGKDASVDEAMIPFKGRSSLKQYMPLKPVKRGIKVWALADASNGYMSNFQVYTGRQGNSVEKGLGTNVVTTLTKPYVNSFRHVYFDNFFTSTDLLLELERSNLYGCGTMRINRKGFPADLKPVVKKRFEGERRLQDVPGQKPYRICMEGQQGSGHCSHQQRSYHRGGNTEEERWVNNSGEVSPVGSPL